MNTILRTGLFAILFLALIFSSCQNETIQETPNDPQENISEGSDLLTYLRSSTSSENNNNNNIEDDCVDFEFPITLLVYDADWEIMQTVVAESNQDLWYILDIIDESTYVSINYPVTLIYQNEVILTVNNNQELLDAFETYDGGCYDLEVLFGCAIDALTVIDVEIQDDVSPTDGITTFSLGLQFFCNDIEYDLQYFETIQNAESQTNPIVFPYTNNTNPQNIYVVATTEYEGVVVRSNVFEINVIIVDGETNVDCNEWNVVEALVINEPGWNITENNIFSENDNVNQYGISFSSDGSLVYGTESPSYLNTHTGTYNIFVSPTGDTLADFETIQNAESQTNPIVFPYTNNTNPQNIYVVATTEYEGVVVRSNVFEINVIIVDGETNVDCNEWNVVEALVINEPGWNITENNIFSENDNVNQYGISFSSDGSLVYGTESPSYLNTHTGTYNIFVSPTGDTLADFSLNDPNLPINPISDETWILTACDLVTGSFTFYQYDMTTGQQGDLYFVLSACDCEDSTFCCLETSLNGKWLPLGGDNTVEPNTMYIFEDGLRYTVYCTENCDWEALGIEDAIPTPLEYIYDYENCLLTTDLNFGNYVTWSTQFVCDEQVLRAYVVETGAEIIFYRPGYDISQCDE